MKCLYLDSEVGYSEAKKVSNSFRAASVRYPLSNLFVLYLTESPPEYSGYQTKDFFSAARGGKLEEVEGFLANKAVFRDYQSEKVCLYS